MGFSLGRYNHSESSTSVQNTKAGIGYATCMGHQESICKQMQQLLGENTVSECAIVQSLQSPRS